jgi:hypothetical protein
MAVVRRWLDELGFAPEDWPKLPPFRTLLPMLAALRLSAEMGELSTTDAIRLAAEELGVEDDPDRNSSHHPADGIPHTLRRWQRAVEARGQNVRADDCDAP